MKVVADPRQFQTACDDVRRAGHRLAVVPTMGALHEGHLSLIDLAQRSADRVAVTIFVNPTQFAPNEDLERYPRPLADDLEACRQRGVDIAFTPENAAMYPPGDATRVRVNGLDQQLCGASRPHHFEGVCTVVSKLLLLAGPCQAVFGRKDYQQLQIIKRLTRDLFFPVEIAAGAIVREADGLAMSSRNRRLDPQQRADALGLARGLSAAQAAFNAGERQAQRLVARATEQVEAHRLAIDYVSLVDAASLTPLERVTERALLAVAAYAGETRLIDNVVLGEDGPVVVGSALP